jgi:hypothetical protein
MEVGLGGQSQTFSRRPQAIKNNETWANNEGLFVKAKLQNKCWAFLITEFSIISDFSILIMLIVI